MNGYTCYGSAMPKTASIHVLSLVNPTATLISFFLLLKHRATNKTKVLSVRPRGQCQPHLTRIKVSEGLFPWEDWGKSVSLFCTTPRGSWPLSPSHDTVPPHPPLSELLPGGTGAGSKVQTGTARCGNGQIISYFQDECVEGWGHSSAAECLSSMPEGLGLNPRTVEKKSRPTEMAGWLRNPLNKRSHGSLRPQQLHKKPGMTQHVRKPYARETGAGDSD